MKKVFILFSAITLCLSSTAQNNKVTSAKMHIDEFNSHGDTSELKAAKQSIDDASVYEKTKDEPKMYLYRGEVYLTLFTTHFNSLFSKLMLSVPATQKKNASKLRSEAYSKMDTNELCIATNSFIKVLQLAPKDYYAEEAKDPSNLPTCKAHLENKAYCDYADGHYASALALSEKLITIYNLLNISDSSYKETIELAANSADKAGNMGKALAYYQKMIDLKYGGASPYQYMAAMYFRNNDTTKAWACVEKGRAQYPDDLQLIIFETNYYITKHDYDKAEANLTLSINKVEQRPDKEKNINLLASLYTNLGGIYDHMANPKDSKGQDAAKPADYEDLFSKAEANYNKALALTPDNFDLLYNLGALYFNRAVPLVKQANDLPYNATDKYNKLIAQAKDYFLKAQPFFEKAYKINPNDPSNTTALSQVYVNTNQNDKAEALKSKK